jgi:hypothetical protein
MDNRPEIKVYPVENYQYYPNPDWGQPMGHETTHMYHRRERSGRSYDEDVYLRGLIGKSVMVHTAGSGELRGVLDAVLIDAIIIRTEGGGRLLIHDWAIAAIQSE